MSSFTTKCLIHEVNCEWNIKCFNRLHNEVQSGVFTIPNFKHLTFNLKLKQHIKENDLNYEIDKSHLDLSFSFVSGYGQTNFPIYADISISFQSTNKPYSVVSEKKLFKSPNELTFTWYSIEVPELRNNQLRILATIQVQCSYIANSSITVLSTVQSTDAVLKKEKDLFSHNSINQCINMLNRLYTESMFHDVIIKVEGQEIPAHRAILSARSPVFLAMFTYNTTEKNSGIIDLDKSSKVSTWKILQYFIYTGLLDFTKGEDTFKNDKNVDIRAELKAVPSGDLCKNEIKTEVKYECQQLKDLIILADRYSLLTAVNEIEFIMSNQVNDDNLCEYLRCAHELNLSSLEESCFKFFNKYDSSNKNLTLNTAAWISLTNDHPDLLRSYLKFCLK